MIRFSKTLVARLAQELPAGFTDYTATMAREGESYWEFTDEAARKWHKYCSENRAIIPKPRPGLGDAVAAIATPIARALGLSCIDPATRQLRPESPCAQRKAALNRLSRGG